MQEIALIIEARPFCLVYFRIVVVIEELQMWSAMLAKTDSSIEAYLLDLTGSTILLVTLVVVGRGAIGLLMDVAFSSLLVVLKPLLAIETEAEARTDADALTSSDLCDMLIEARVGLGIADIFETMEEAAAATGLAILPPTTRAEFDFPFDLDEMLRL